MRFTKEGDNFKENLREKVEKISNVNLSSCYQCGKCSAGCPMAESMDITPNQIMRLLNLGDFDTVFNCKAIWDCISCEICTTRCPRELDPAAVMDALRILSKAKGYKGSRNSVEKFNKIFLYCVQMFGRLYEPGLVGGFNMYNVTPFKDVFDLAPAMFFKGKLKPWNFPHIEDIEEVKVMIEKCNKYAEEERTQKK
ncbi:MAG TPA: 4Fe-4S dicluster domain-containing protein [Candidatus Eremiobacteraeota bacterium]|nr:MAG: succinate dehydrogenase iron-sulfur subunit [bacterium ADurb.Bin363]HPZ07665.1 4Fe-4S dicluster domain-containing protein [Candidatus Eremiobacteraeota bacterium]